LVGETISSIQRFDEKEAGDMSDDRQSTVKSDRWDSGASYEAYVGRWSRLVARELLNWLDVPSGSRWLDVGCGTGVLSQTILQRADPREVTGVDRSEAFIAFARDQVVDGRASFVVGDAQQLPIESDRYDAAVSGLALNFIPDKIHSVMEMARVVKPGGVVAAYVWDYADQMQMMRVFWDAVTALHPESRELDEGRRFPLCFSAEALMLPFVSLSDVLLERFGARSIVIPTHFRDFDDYWTPFLGGTGTAPTYVQSLTERERIELRDYIQTHLPIGSDGSIELIARAWVVRAYKPRD
jgi:SAM-dependent methyltransferase